MAYELWDQHNANLLDDFESEAEAVAAVRILVEKHGPDAVCAWSLALAYEDDTGETHPIAAEATLFALTTPRGSATP